MVVSLMRLAVAADPQGPTKRTDEWDTAGGGGGEGGHKRTEGMEHELTRANQGRAIDSHVCRLGWELSVCNIVRQAVCQIPAVISLNLSKSTIKREKCTKPEQEGAPGLPTTERH